MVYPLNSSYVSLVRYRTMIMLGIVHSDKGSYDEESDERSELVILELLYI